METNCDICDGVRETRYFDLFVTGSEGTRLCHKCEMMVVEFIREKTREYQRKRMRAIPFNREDALNPEVY